MDFIYSKLNQGLVDINKIKEIKLLVCQEVNNPIEGLQVGDYYLAVSVYDSDRIVYSDLSLINEDQEALKVLIEGNSLVIPEQEHFEPIGYVDSIKSGNDYIPLQDTRIDTHNFNINIDQIDSDNASAGYVLTADGEGGVYWSSSDLTNYYTKNEVNALLDEKQDTLVSGTNIKTLDNNSVLGSGNIDIKAYKTFPTSWKTNTTIKAFCDDVNADMSAVAGMAYLGELKCNDLPISGNLDTVVEIMEGPSAGSKAIHIICTSGDTAPYRWEYTYWGNGSSVSGWIGFQPEITSSNKISSDLVDDAGHTNKFVTTEEKAAWSNKQDALPSTINNTYLHSDANGNLEWSDIPAELPEVSGHAGQILKVNSNASGVEWGSDVDTGATSIETTGNGNAVTSASYDSATRKITLTKGTTFLTEHQPLVSLGNKIDLEIDNDYKLTAKLYHDNTLLSTSSVIDLPLESVVVNGSYDDTTKKVILTLQNGDTIEFSVADLISGLQAEITSSNKLSSDLVDDTNKTNKFVTASEKSTWSGKQDAINDLQTIREGASLGATALQSVPSEYITETELGNYHDSSKQDVLTAGSNIQINNNVISATDTTYSLATASISGLMSSSDKSKLDTIESGAQVNPSNYLTVASASGNTLTLTKQNGSDIVFTPTFTEVHVGDVVNIDAVIGSNLVIGGTASVPTVGVATGYSIPSDSQQSVWSNKQDALPTVVNNKYLHSDGSGNLEWSDTPKELPSTLGVAGQALKVNANADGVEWGNVATTDTNYYNTPSYSTGLKIGTGTGVNDLYVPYATTSSAGVVSVGNGFNIVSGTLSVDDSVVALQSDLPVGTETVLLNDSTITPSTTTALSNIVVGNDTDGYTKYTVSSGMSNPMTTMGDLIVGGSSGTPTRLGLGTDGQVLISNGTTAAWSNPAIPSSISYLTTAPSSDNTSGALQIVVLSSEPATRYNGYLYIITGSAS